jgi:uncharacterized membrane protein YebE (DUF533 family)
MKQRTELIARILLVTAVFISATAVVEALAYSPGQTTPSVDRREARQRRRINSGVHSGSLTKREAAQINRQQARIRAHEAYAKSDGRVTARERASIQRQENRASRNIYRKKHNNRTR